MTDPTSKVLAVEGALWDTNTQRVIIGLLVERLGGLVVLTENDIAQSPSCRGSCSLYCEVQQGQLSLSVIPGNKDERT